MQLNLFKTTEIKYNKFLGLINHSVIIKIKQNDKRKIDK